MCILNSFTEVEILYFGCMKFKILFAFHKKVKTPSCYFEKNLNTLLSLTLKKVFALLHSESALLYSKFFKPTKRLFSPKKMERDEKKNELLNFIREYRFVREEELMFHIRASMEEVHSTCQKVELREKIKVSLSELPLSVK